jgi:hypothetical protein
MHIVIVLLLLINCINDRVAVWQRANLHRAIGSTRKHSTHLINVDLCDSLTGVFEEAAVLMLTRIVKEWRADWRWQCPDL